MPTSFSFRSTRTLMLAVALKLLAPAATFAAPDRSATTCAEDLGGPAATSIFPWPEPTPEMVAAMIREVGEPTDPDGRALRRLLERPSAHAIIRDLFLPFTATEVRTFYGPRAKTPPPMHPIRYDINGHRQLIARSLAAIPDRARQAAWLDFMKHDADAAVKLQVAGAFLHWPDANDREAVLATELARPRPDPYVLRAAIRNPNRISPGLRWQLIRRLARGEHVDSTLRKAIDTFPEPAVLHAWYADRVVVTGMQRALAEYDPSRLHVKHRHADLPGLTFTAHDFDAYDYAFDLTTLNADHLRNAQLATLMRLERFGDDRARFVRDVLSWAEIQEILRNYALARQSEAFDADADRALTLDKLRDAARGSHVRLAWAKHLMAGNERDWQNGARVPARVNWTEDTLKRLASTFERPSRPAE